MDLNLLTALDALLQEGSVTRAADQLGTSPAAMSRKLASLRRIVGDPLLVRAGQQMVPTDRALELRTEVRALIERTEAILTSTRGLDVASLNRTFTVQASDALLAALAAPLISRTRSQAPAVGVTFIPESVEDTPALRQGSVDLELGVLDHLDPETHTEPLARVPMVATARHDHPLFDAPINARRFADADHIGISRTGKRHGPIDTALGKLGLRRNIAAVVPSHTSAMMLARTTDLVCLTIATGNLPDAVTALGLRTFPIPLNVPPIEIGMAWHPRHDTDTAHRWFRDQVRTTIGGQT
ncbi:LysR family transcriptional regulator [Streptomyces sediminimaris]|uniref:LysR family transcriptional regulator n=1 Tax=Streptomyces sediminimaris TaxID=3383721 RepID=UPI00399A47DB